MAIFPERNTEFSPHVPADSRDATGGLSVVTHRSALTE